MSQEKLHWIVADEQQGERVDVFLTKSITNQTRSTIQKWIEIGYVTINGKQVKANHRLKSAQTIEVVLPDPEPTELKPENIPLDILFEDEHLIVLNKPRGLVVHPAPGHYTGTLVHALLYHCQFLSNLNGPLRPGIVHRLDKDTSGVMMVAKTDLAHRNLASQIQSHTAKREYKAIVYGNIGEEKGEIIAPIGRDPHDRKKMAVVFENSREATTHFQVLERFGNFTFIACRLLTGRTHQIRVHMAYIKHPVACDPLYGPERNPFSEYIEGQALHSHSLDLVHPVTGKELHFSAPLPQDMTSILQWLRQRS